MKYYITASIILLIAGSVLAEPSSGWPTSHGYFNRNGYSSAKLPTKPTRLWRFKTKGEIVKTPVAGNGLIYFSTTTGNICALTEDGQTVWSKEIDEKPLSAALSFINGVIVCGTDGGIVYGLDSAKGTQLWTYDTEDNIQSGATSDGKNAIIITQSSGSIHALNIKSGKKKWIIKETNRCDGPPSTANGRIAFGNCDAALHTFKSKSGKKINSVSLGESGQVAAGTAMIDDQAYVGAYNGDLFCLNLKSGEITWQYSENNSSVSSTPAINSKLAVFTADNGSVICLNRLTGKLIWETEMDDTVLSPAITEDRLVISSAGTLSILDLTDGSLLWSTNISDDITAPSIINGLIVVGTDTGHVIAYGDKDE